MKKSIYQGITYKKKFLSGFFVVKNILISKASRCLRKTFFFVSRFKKCDAIIKIIYFYVLSRSSLKSVLFWGQFLKMGAPCCWSFVPKTYSRVSDKTTQTSFFLFIIIPNIIQTCKIFRSDLIWLNCFIKIRREINCCLWQKIALTLTNLWCTCKDQCYE